MPDKKRLAVFVASLAQGGIGKMRLHLIQQFLDLGVDVDLLVADADSPYMHRVDPRVHVVGLPTSHAITSVPAIARYLRQRRPDAMLTQRIRVNVAALRGRWLARMDTPIFSTFNTNLSAQFASLPEPKARRQLATLRRYYPRNDGLMAVSRGVAADAASLLGVPTDSIPVVYNPVVTPSLAEQAAEPLRDPWFEDPRIPVLLGVGRLEPQKNFANLIDAFAQVRQRRECRLVVLGEGKLRAELTSRIRDLGVEDDVRLPGFVTNPYQYMRQASLYVLSSSWEGLPNALMESMAVGTPVVATNCPNGPDEILEGGKHGRLVPVNDSGALAAAINATLDAPPDPDDLRRAARRFEAGTNARRYLEIMKLL
jgi:glycosyltransferase involved in cell wall biosynthesis